MIKFKNKKGDFSKTKAFLTKSLNFTKIRKIDEAARNCINKLIEATPIDSGLTAASWTYEIVRNCNDVTLTISNTNIQNGVNVAILLEFGHGTNGGTWVEGKNFIMPIVKETYDKIINETWEEIERL